MVAYGKDLSQHRIMGSRDRGEILTFSSGPFYSMD